MKRLPKQLSPTMYNSMISDFFIPHPPIQLSPKTFVESPSKMTFYIANNRYNKPLLHPLILLVCKKKRNKDRRGTGDNAVLRYTPC